MMKLKNYALITLLAGSLFYLQSCKDDEEPVFEVTQTTVDADGYSGSGTPTLMYSIDGGATYTATMPELRNGDKLLVKISNGTSDITEDDFTFDWSGSSPAPENAESDVAEFTIEDEDVSISVNLSDIFVFITTHRKSGKINMIDMETGAKTELVAPTYDGAALTDLRSIAYHPGEGLFFVTTHTRRVEDDIRKGELYTIDPATLVATMINANDGNDGAYAKWDAVVNWFVASDDSLVAIGDFNSDGNGIVKFGTDGGRSPYTISADICCGLGALYDREEEEFIIANGSDTGNEEIILETLDMSGDLSNPITITNFTGFSTSFEDSWLTMKAMALDASGNLYGILYDSDGEVTYYVSIDTAGLEIEYIATLGDNQQDQYNSLNLLAKHLL
jgi:hypothetical protein